MKIKEKIMDYFRKYRGRKVFTKSVSLAVVICFLINIANVPAFGQFTKSDEELMKKELKINNKHEAVINPRMVKPVSEQVGVDVSAVTDLNEGTKRELDRKDMAIISIGVINEKARNGKEHMVGSLDDKGEINIYSGDSSRPFDKKTEEDYKFRAQQVIDSGAKRDEYIATYSREYLNSNGNQNIIESGEHAEPQPQSIAKEVEHKEDMAEIEGDTVKEKGVEQTVQKEQLQVVSGQNVNEQSGESKQNEIMLMIKDKKDTISVTKATIAKVQINAEKAGLNLVVEKDFSGDKNKIEIYSSKFTGENVFVGKAGGQMAYPTHEGNVEIRGSQKTINIGGNEFESTGISLVRGIPQQQDDNTINKKTEGLFFSELLNVYDKKITDKQMEGVKKGLSEKEEVDIVTAASNTVREVINHTNKGVFTLLPAADIAAGIFGAADVKEDNAGSESTQQAALSVAADIPSASVSPANMIAETVVESKDFDIPYASGRSLEAIQKEDISSLSAIASGESTEAIRKESPKDEDYNYVVEELAKQTGLSKKEVEAGLDKIDNVQLDKSMGILASLLKNGADIVNCSTDALSKVLQSSLTAPLALAVLVSDISSGAFAKNNTGEDSQIMISAAALQEAAAKEGKELSGREITAQDLDAALKDGGQAILHVSADGKSVADHYITLSKDADGKVKIQDINKTEITVDEKDLAGYLQNTYNWTGGIALTENQNTGTPVNNEKLQSAVGAVSNSMPLNVIKISDTDNNIPTYIKKMISPVNKKDSAKQKKINDVKSKYKTEYKKIEEYAYSVKKYTSKQKEALKQRISDAVDNAPANKTLTAKEKKKLKEEIFNTYVSRREALVTKREKWFEAQVKDLKTKRNAAIRAISSGKGTDVAVKEFETALNKLNTYVDNVYARRELNKKNNAYTKTMNGLANFGVDYLNKHGKAKPEELKKELNKEAGKLVKKYYATNADIKDAKWKPAESSSSSKEMPTDLKFGQEGATATEWKPAASSSKTKEIATDLKFGQEGATAMPIAADTAKKAPVTAKQKEINSINTKYRAEYKNIKEYAYSVKKYTPAQKKALKEKISKAVENAPANKTLTAKEKENLKAELYKIYISKRNTLVKKREDWFTNQVKDLKTKRNAAIRAINSGKGTDAAVKEFETALNKLNTYVDNVYARRELNKKNNAYTKTMNGLANFGVDYLNKHGKAKPEELKKELNKEAGKLIKKYYATNADVKAAKGSTIKSSTKKEDAEAEDYNYVVEELAKQTGLSKKEVEAELDKIDDAQLGKSIGILAALLRNGADIVNCSTDALSKVLKSSLTAPLALAALVRDISSGAFIKNNTGKAGGKGSQIMISAAALQEAASEEGTELSGREITAQDLDAALEDGGQAILHVSADGKTDANHYITLSKDAAGKVKIQDINKTEITVDEKDLAGYLQNTYNWTEGVALTENQNIGKAVSKEQLQGSKGALGTTSTDQPTIGFNGQPRAPYNPSPQIYTNHGGTGLRLKTRQERFGTYISPIGKYNKKTKRWDRNPDYHKQIRQQQAMINYKPTDPFTNTINGIFNSYIKNPINDFINDPIGWALKNTFPLNSLREAYILLQQADVFGGVTKLQAADKNYLDSLDSLDGEGHKNGGVTTQLVINDPENGITGYRIIEPVVIDGKIVNQVSYVINKDCLGENLWTVTVASDGTSSTDMNINDRPQGRANILKKAMTSKEDGVYNLGPNFIITRKSDGNIQKTTTKMRTEKKNGEIASGAGTTTINEIETNKSTGQTVSINTYRVRGNGLAGDKNNFYQMANHDEDFLVNSTVIKESAYFNPDGSLDYTQKLSGKSYMDSNMNMQAYNLTGTMTMNGITIDVTEKYKSEGYYQAVMNDLSQLGYGECLALPENGLDTKFDGINLDNSFIFYVDNGIWGKSAVIIDISGNKIEGNAGWDISDNRVVIESNEESGDGSKKNIRIHKGDDGRLNFEIYWHKEEEVHNEYTHKDDIVTTDKPIEYGSISYNHNDGSVETNSVKDKGNGRLEQRNTQTDILGNTTIKLIEGTYNTAGVYDEDLFKNPNHFLDIKGYEIKTDSKGVEISHITMSGNLINIKWDDDFRMVHYEYDNYTEVDTRTGLTTTYVSGSWSKSEVETIDGTKDKEIYKDVSIKITDSYGNLLETRLVNEIFTTQTFYFDTYSYTEKHYEKKEITTTYSDGSTETFKAENYIEKTTNSYSAAHSKIVGGKETIKTESSKTEISAYKQTYTGDGNTIEIINYTSSYIAYSDNSSHTSEKADEISKNGRVIKNVTRETSVDASGYSTTSGSGFDGVKVASDYSGIHTIAAEMIGNSTVRQGYAEIKDWTFNAQVRTAVVVAAIAATVAVTILSFGTLAAPMVAAWGAILGTGFAATAAAAATIAVTTAVAAYMAADAARTSAMCFQKGDIKGGLVFAAIAIVTIASAGALGEAAVGIVEGVGALRAAMASGEGLFTQLFIQAGEQFLKSQGINIAEQMSKDIVIKAGEYVVKQAIINTVKQIGIRAAIGTISGFVGDIGYQLYANGGDFGKVDLNEALTWAAIGGLSGAASVNVMAGNRGAAEILSIGMNTVIMKNSVESAVYNFTHDNFTAGIMDLALISAFLFVSAQNRVMNKTGMAPKGKSGGSNPENIESKGFKDKLTGIPSAAKNKINSFYTGVKDINITQSMKTFTGKIAGVSAKAMQQAMVNGVRVGMATTSLYILQTVSGNIMDGKKIWEGLLDKDGGISNITTMYALGIVLGVTLSAAAPSFTKTWTEQNIEGGFIQILGSPLATLSESMQAAVHLSQFTAVVSPALSLGGALLVGLINDIDKVFASIGSPISGGFGSVIEFFGGTGDESLINSEKRNTALKNAFVSYGALLFAGKNDTKLVIFGWDTGLGFGENGTVDPDVTAYSKWNETRHSFATGLIMSPFFKMAIPGTEMFKNSGGSVGAWINRQTTRIAEQGNVINAFLGAFGANTEGKILGSIIGQGSMISTALGIQQFMWIGSAGAKIGAGLDYLLDLPPTYTSTEGQQVGLFEFFLQNASMLFVPMGLNAKGKSYYESIDTMNGKYGKDAARAEALKVKAKYGEKFNEELSKMSPQEAQQQQMIGAELLAKANKTIVETSSARELNAAVSENGKHYEFKNYKLDIVEAPEILKNDLEIRRLAVEKVAKEAKEGKDGEYKSSNVDVLEAMQREIGTGGGSRFTADFIAEMVRLEHVDALKKGGNEGNKRAAEIEETVKQFNEEINNQIIENFGRTDLFNAIDLLNSVYADREFVNKVSEVTVIQDMRELKELKSGESTFEIIEKQVSNKSAIEEIEGRLSKLTPNERAVYDKIYELIEKAESKEISAKEFSLILNTKNAEFAARDLYLSGEKGKEITKTRKEIKTLAEKVRKQSFDEMKETFKKNKAHSELDPQRAEEINNERLAEESIADMLTQSESYKNEGRNIEMPVNYDSIVNSQIVARNDIENILKGSKEYEKLSEKEKQDYGNTIEKFIENNFELGKIEGEFGYEYIENSLKSEDFKRAKTRIELTGKLYDTKNMSPKDRVEKIFEFKKDLMEAQEAELKAGEEAMLQEAENNKDKAEIKKNTERAIESLKEMNMKTLISEYLGVTQGVLSRKASNDMLSKIRSQKGNTSASIEEQKIVLEVFELLGSPDYFDSISKTAEYNSKAMEKLKVLFENFARNHWDKFDSVIEDFMGEHKLKEITDLRDFIADTGDKGFEMTQNLRNKMAKNAFGVKSEADLSFSERLALDLKISEIGYEIPSLKKQAKDEDLNKFITDKFKGEHTDTFGVGILGRNNVKGTNTLNQVLMLHENLLGRVSAVSAGGGKTFVYMWTYSSYFSMVKDASKGEFLGAKSTDAEQVGGYEKMQNKYMWKMLGIETVNGEKLYKDHKYDDLADKYTGNLKANSKGRVITYSIGQRGFVELQARVGKGGEKLDVALDNVHLRVADEADVAALSKVSFIMGSGDSKVNPTRANSIYNDLKTLSKVIKSEDINVKAESKEALKDNEFTVIDGKVECGKALEGEILKQFDKSAKSLQGMKNGEQISNIMRAMYAMEAKNQGIESVAFAKGEDGFLQPASIESGTRQSNTTDQSSSYNVALTALEIARLNGGKFAERFTIKGEDGYSIDIHQVKKSVSIGESTISQIFSRGQDRTLNCGGSGTLDVAREVAHTIFGGEAVDIQASSMEKTVGELGKRLTIEEYNHNRTKEILKEVLENGGVKSEIVEDGYFKSTEKPTDYQNKKTGQYYEKVTTKDKDKADLMIKDGFKCDTEGNRIGLTFGAMDMSYNANLMIEALAEIYAKKINENPSMKMTVDKELWIEKIKQATNGEQLSEVLEYVRKNYEILGKETEQMQVIDANIAETSPEKVSTMAETIGKITFTNLSSLRGIDYKSIDLYVLDAHNFPSSELLQAIGRAGRNSEYGKSATEVTLFMDKDSVKNTIQEMNKVDNYFKENGSKGLFADNEQLNSNFKEALKLDSNDGEYFNSAKTAQDIVEMVSVYKSMKLKSESIMFKARQEAENILVKEPLSDMLALARDAGNTKDAEYLQWLYEKAIQNSESNIFGGGKSAAKGELSDPIKTMEEAYTGVLKTAKATLTEAYRNTSDSYIKYKLLERIMDIDSMLLVDGVFTRVIDSANTKGSDGYFDSTFAGASREVSFSRGLSPARDIAETLGKLSRHVLPTESSSKSEIKNVKVEESFATDKMNAEQKAAAKEITDIIKKNPDYYYETIGGEKMLNNKGKIFVALINQTIKNEDEDKKGIAMLSKLTGMDIDLDSLLTEKDEKVLIAQKLVNGVDKLWDNNIRNANAVENFVNLAPLMNLNSLNGATDEERIEKFQSMINFTYSDSLKDFVSRNGKGYEFLSPQMIALAKEGMLKDEALQETILENYNAINKASVDEQIKGITLQRELIKKERSKLSMKVSMAVPEMASWAGLGVKSNIKKIDKALNVPIAEMTKSELKARLYAIDKFGDISEDAIEALGRFISSNDNITSVTKELKVSEMDYFNSFASIYNLVKDGKIDEAVFKNLSAGDIKAVLQGNKAPGEILGGEDKKIYEETLGIGGDEKNFVNTAHSYTMNSDGGKALAERENEIFAQLNNQPDNEQVDMNEMFKAMSNIEDSIDIEELKMSRLTAIEKIGAIIPESANAENTLDAMKMQISNDGKLSEEDGYRIELLDRMHKILAAKGVDSSKYLYALMRNGEIEDSINIDKLTGPYSMMLLVRYILEKENGGKSDIELDNMISSMNSVNEVKVMGENAAVYKSTQKGNRVVGMLKQFASMLPDVGGTIADMADSIASPVIRNLRTDNITRRSNEAQKAFNEAKEQFVESINNENAEVMEMLKAIEAGNNIIIFNEGQLQQNTAEDKLVTLEGQLQFTGDIVASPEFQKAVEELEEKPAADAASSVAGIGSAGKDGIVETFSALPDTLNLPAPDGELRKEEKITNKKEIVKDPQNNNSSRIDLNKNNIEKTEEKGYVLTKMVNRVLNGITEPKEIDRLLAATLGTWANYEEMYMGFGLTEEGAKNVGTIIEAYKNNMLIINEMVENEEMSREKGIGWLNVYTMTRDLLVAVAQTEDEKKRGDFIKMFDNFELEDITDENKMDQIKYYLKNANRKAMMEIVVEKKVVEDMLGIGGRLKEAVEKKRDTGAMAFIARVFKGDENITDVFPIAMNDMKGKKRGTIPNPVLVRALAQAA
ncbi:MAG: hypothetical protein FWH43_04735 [Endomicrobia bacterium]|nr:hypothetical protein [Endomicrobiia bacterium]